MMADRDVAEAHYRAFLSYSHKDGAAAARLHRRLEAYRIPKRLAGRETARGPVPRRLMPIFRDREELPAATDLSETVREALARSGALIVICSPAAAASLWVAEEIRVFRELHPGRPVLAAILDGDPPDCFPAVLRETGEGHEPLATDLRRDGDGERLGLLKLVAGIAGLGLDDLVQRDAARRVRSVMAVTAGAVMAMLVMAVLVVMAVSARREAERQRAEVGKQIEFMITDLRERLRGVGRLDVMAAVNRHALAYYDGQTLGDLDSASLERRARVLHAIGEDALARSDFAAALVAFTEAHRTTAEQLSRAPDDPVRTFTHAQSEYWLGEIHYSQRRLPQALASFQRYAEAARRLVAVSPNNPDYMMESGYGATNVGRVQLLLSDPENARRSFQAALSWFQRVESVRPGDGVARRKQGNSYAWLADTYYTQRRWRDALLARRHQHGIYLALWRSEPSNMARRYELALAERAVGRQLSIIGENEEALSYLLSAYRNAEALRRVDAHNTDWLALQARIECDLIKGWSESPLPVPLATLRENVARADGELRRLHNPAQPEISTCLR